MEINTEIIHTVNLSQKQIIEAIKEYANRNSHSKGDLNFHNSEVNIDVNVDKYFSTNKKECDESIVAKITLKVKN